MAKFPDWVKVQYFDIDQFYDLKDSYPELGIDYQEMEEMNRGDLNKVAQATVDDNVHEETRQTGIEIYLTFHPEILIPKQAAPTAVNIDSGELDDTDEFMPDSGTPNIGLVFNDGVYQHIGLGGDRFSDVIERHFEPYMGKPGDYDAILDAALKEVHDTFTVQGIADEVE